MRFSVYDVARLHANKPEQKYPLSLFGTVRRRSFHDTHGRRGRITDPVYKYRKLLTCNIEKLSNKQTARLKEVLASDVELGVVYAIKEHVRDF